MAKCITLNGTLYRVDSTFDEREDSDDMKHLRELDKAMREGLTATLRAPSRGTIRNPEEITKRGDRG